MNIFKLSGYKKSLKIKTTVFITIILIIAMGATLFINVLQFRKSMRAALENEIVASGVLIRSTIFNNLRYFTLDRFSGMPEFFKDIIKTNNKISYCFVSDQNGTVLYHNNTHWLGYRLNKKKYTKALLNAPRITVTVGKYYETILPIFQFVYSDITRIGNIHIGVRRSVIDKELLKIVIITIIIFIISLATILALLLVFIAKKVVNPVSNLSNQMQQITNKMKFDKEIEIKGQDEISDLANNFNIMIQKIRHYSDNLEDIVIERTQDLNNANKMLESASLELQASNVKLLKDLEIAKRLQESVVKNIQTFPEVNVDSVYMAMESLGGDIYDVRRLGKSTFSFMISDVSGHGVPAALITTMAKMSFINHGHFSKNPAQICFEVNKDMVELISDSDYYLTAFYAILDVENLTLSYTNCGHQKPILCRSGSGKIEELDSKGFFLGSFEESEYEYSSIKLQVHDRILFFTDGITEARNNDGEFYSQERLVDFLKKNADVPYNKILKLFLQEFNAFCQNRPVDDDIALLLVEVTSKRSENNVVEFEFVSDAISNPLEKNNDEAVNIFRDVYKELELDKNSLEKQLKTSISYYKENNFSKAKDILTKLLPYFPNHIRILNTIAAIYYKNGEYDAALKCYSKIKELNPDYPRIKETIKLVEKHIETDTNF
jgi:sigma-B regulation protein RsbU (phosphoserine phosphatase)